MSGLLARAAYHRNPPHEVRDEARPDELAAEAADQARAEVVSVSVDGFLQQIEPLLSNLDRLSASHPICFTPPSIESQNILKNPFWRLWKIEGLVYMPTHLQPFISAYGTIYARRRLHVTENNHLGLGPTSLIVGDSVWLLAASNVPFVLRRSNVARPCCTLGPDIFELVSETCVHGIMYGEALKGRDLDFKEIEFV